MRLIDAGALKEYMCNTCPNQERCRDTENVCSTIADIAEQPTIEAEPVKQGRWEIGGVCSKCGFMADDFSIKWFDYCPNCGARMDGDSE